MQLQVDSSSVIVFDLDDTLYKEVDFVASAYQEIARLIAPAEASHLFQEMWECYLQKRDTFAWLIEQYAPNYTISELVEIYRFHTPRLELPKESLDLLTQLKSHAVTLGVITDGREKTQMNKLHALGIVDMFDKIVISEAFGSEKPCEANYLAVQSAYPEANFLVYIADNPRKDFVAPNKLGWTTIGLKDDGRNIHTQNIEVPIQHRPQHTIGVLSDISVVVRNGF